MKFHSDECQVPDGFRTDEFIFRPLRSTDVELDYDAVITSSLYLRDWSQSAWPADGFTLEENLEDLQRHEQEHSESKAFTYTIVNPDETKCLGCIYINSLDPEIIDLGICGNSPSDSHGGSVRFWVRKSLIVTDAHRAVRDAIFKWLERGWYFDCFVCLVSQADPHQIRLMSDGEFRSRGSFVYRPRNSHWRIYQKNSILPESDKS